MYVYWDKKHFFQIREKSFNDYKCPFCAKPDLKNVSEQNNLYLDSLTSCLKELFVNEKSIFLKFTVKLTREN